MEIQQTVTNAPEPWVGFDDAVSIWMALVTERERLKRIIETKCIDEPMFGPPRGSKMLTDAQVDDVAKKLARVTELANLVMARRREIAAAFAEEVPT